MRRKAICADALIRPYRATFSRRELALEIVEFESSLFNGLRHPVKCCSFSPNLKELSYKE